MSWIWNALKRISKNSMYIFEYLNYICIYLYYLVEVDQCNDYYNYLYIINTKAESVSLHNICTWTFI